MIQVNTPSPDGLLLGLYVYRWMSVVSLWFSGVRLTSVVLVFNASFSSIPSVIQLFPFVPSPSPPSSQSSFPVANFLFSFLPPVLTQLLSLFLAPSPLSPLTQPCLTVSAVSSPRASWLSARQWTVVKLDWSAVWTSGWHHSQNFHTGIRTGDCLFLIMTIVMALGRWVVY